MYNNVIQIVGVGITNQRETTVVWDKITGAPLHNAIVWMDSRTSGVCEEMAAHGGSDRFRDTTGLPVSTYFSAYKLRWLLRNVQNVKKAAHDGRAAFGTVDSWLIYCLTGGNTHVTDVTNASRTNLMDLKTFSWHEDTLEAFEIPKGMLPQIRSSAEVYGCINTHKLMDGIPSLTFVADIDQREIPICGCLGDQQAAMMGHRCQKQDAKCTYGTGAFLLAHTGTEPVFSKHGLLTTVAHQLGPKEPVSYALEGSIAVAGAGVSWLRDGLGIISTASESETVASSVSDTGGVYLVPAFSGLLAPWWRDDARGIIIGLSQYTKKGHIVRAMLEAIAFQIRSVVEAIESDTSGELNSDVDKFISTLSVDGGACANNLLMQLQADIAQLPVLRPGDLETTALGAALAAGIGAGMWTVDQVFDGKEKKNESDEIFQPQISSQEADSRYGKYTLAVERSFGLASLTDAA